MDEIKNKSTPVKKDDEENGNGNGKKEIQKADRQRIPGNSRQKRNQRQRICHCERAGQSHERESRRSHYQVSRTRSFCNNQSASGF